MVVDETRRRLLEHRITAAEMVTTAQAQVVLKLTQTEQDASEAEALLWSQMDELAILRAEWAELYLETAR